jgi:hypothetical protein
MDNRKIYFILILIIYCSCSQAKRISSNSYGDSGTGRETHVSVKFNQLPKELILLDRKDDELDPIRTLIFQGVPGSRQEKPLIPIKDQLRFEKSDISKNASRFINEEYSTFNKIAINLHLLRQYLEKEKVIKTFGL